jgi:sialate O-acetylesterase
MKIHHGLLTGQVVQRDHNNGGSASIIGSCRTAGAVEIRALKNGSVLHGHTWAVAGHANARRFEVMVEDLPTGGPYRIELRIRDGRRTTEHLTVDDIFVGDVWILAGQSNMQGIGNMEDAPRGHPLVRCFSMRDEWNQAEEPIHFLPEAVDVIHNGYGSSGTERPSRRKLGEIRRNTLKGVSPALGFGLEMRRRTRVPQGLIACAHGGTSLAHWSPDQRDRGGASLYGAMMRRYEKLGQPVAGVLWYQGESDTDTLQQALDYTDNMRKLIEAVRRDTGQTKLPWLLVQLGRFASLEKKTWNDIQNQQRLLPEIVPFLDVVAAVDLELDDGIHIGGKAQQILGARLARAANQLVHKTPGVKPGIALESIAMVSTPPWNAPHMISIEVTFAHVAGKLHSPGLPVGFALIDAEGHDTCQIYKTTLRGRRALLHTGLTPEQLKNLTLRYGHGQFPYCTVIDAENMSIPAFTVSLKNVIK